MTPERETKSVSAETTFDADLAHFDVLEPVLWRLCGEGSRRAEAGAGFAGRTRHPEAEDGGLPAAHPRRAPARADAARRPASSRPAASSCAANATARATA